MQAWETNEYNQIKAKLLWYEVIVLFGTANALGNCITHG